MLATKGGSPGFPMTALYDRFFAFDGRLTRLPFFLRGIQIGIVAVIMFFATLPLFMNGSSLLWWAGLTGVILSAAVLVVASFSLTVRRLHDLSLPGYHAIWVVAADLIAQLLSYGSDKALLFSLPLVAIGLWITFWPGASHVNRFGAVPD
jgi:uncharacterized membrane protein YhaH (DUF805 family)